MASLRELAAVTGKDLRIPEAQVLNQNSSGQCRRSAGLRAPDLCPRYGPSRSWCGHSAEPGLVAQRGGEVGCSINNVVDVNFVMLESGQPPTPSMFDASRRDPAGVVSVRARRPLADETFVTLDGIERQPAPDDLLIADGGKGLQLAGGWEENSGISEETTDVLIESATSAHPGLGRPSKAGPADGRQPSV